MLSKKIMIPVFSIAIAGTTLFGASYFLTAHAATGSPFSGIAKVIASKFNLNETDVQNTINSYLQNQKANRLQNASNFEKKRLDALVTNGKITSDQESAILNELSSLQSKYNLSSLQNQTPQQRKQVMQNFRNDLTQWAKNNNINIKYVLPFGRRFGIGLWHRTNLTPTP